jgi:hypothetical protein
MSKGAKSKGSYTARKEKIKSVKNCCDLLSRLIESKEIRRGVMRLSYQCTECGNIDTVHQSKSWRQSPAAGR